MGSFRERTGAGVGELAVPIEDETLRSLDIDQTKLRSIGIEFRNMVDSVRYCLEKEFNMIDTV